jgi:hypothetical protein
VDAIARRLTQAGSGVLRAKGLLTDTDGRRVLLQVVGRQAQLSPAPPPPRPRPPGRDRPARPVRWRALVMSRSPSLSPRAFLMLLLLACMFGGNHVAARFAFNDGVDVATAVTLRSGATALVVGPAGVAAARGLGDDARQRAVLAGVSLLVAVQSLSLYAAVARLPVALALLAFNTWPMWTALWARVLYGHRPERRTLLATPVLLAGAGAGAGRVRRRVGPGRAGAVVAHRRRRGLCHHRRRHLRRGDGDSRSTRSPGHRRPAAQRASRWRVW